VVVGEGNEEMVENTLIDLIWGKRGKSLIFVEDKVRSGGRGKEIQKGRVGRPT